MSRIIAIVNHKASATSPKAKDCDFARVKRDFPSLQTVEYEQLEANILSEGCREGLILWQNGDNYVLIDGHNRYEICQKHGIDFKIVVKEFESLASAKSFMINNQLGRRNLSAEQASYLRGKRYENEKNKQGGMGENQYSKVANFATSKTREKLAEEYKVSERTVANDALFAKAIDKIGEVNPELKKEILSGKTKITKNQVQELAKMENLPMLEDLVNLFHFPKNPQAKNEFSEKTKVEVLKEKLHKIFKSEKLNESEKAEVITYIEKLIRPVTGS